MASIFKEAPCNNHPEWAYVRPLYATIIIQSLFIMFELTLTAHIMIIRWCLYLIPYYLLKSQLLQKWYKREDHLHITFPIIFKIPSWRAYFKKKYHQINIATILRVLTRVLGGKMDYWLLTCLWAKLLKTLILGEGSSRSTNHRITKWRDCFNILLDGINI